MRGDVLQRAGSGQSGCFEPLDDLFDLRQPRLEGTELVPDAVQFLRKNFGLGAPGRHRSEPILSLASVMPVLKDVGIEAGKPELLEIHNIIRR
jgi:hypothetical protein